MLRERSKELTVNHFDKTAKNYDNSSDGKFVQCMYQEILDRAEKIPAKRILDLGCGNGNAIALLRDRIPAEYYGLDISENMIEEARIRLGKAVSFSVGDAEHLPYENQTFDLIICNASFHHYPGPGMAVKEMKRVLKPGGTIILGDPTIKWKILVPIFDWLIKFTPSGDAKVWHKDDITVLFQENGFRVEQFKYLNQHAFMFNAVIR